MDPLLILQIGVLTCLATLGVGGAGLMILAGRREKEVARSRAKHEKATRTESPAGGVPLALDTVRRLGERVSKGKVSKNLRSRLASAGLHSRSAPAVFLGTKSLLFVAGLAAAAPLALLLSAPVTVKVFLVCGVATWLFFVPDLIVLVRRGKRTTEIQQRLPDAIDLLEICVNSGMGMDTAWGAVAAEARRVSPTLSDEMELTTLEIGLGVERAVAMRHMSERTGVDDISSLVALLVQAERFGSSIAEALQIFARSLRQIQSTRAEESAEKMAVKLLFPMVLFIFPSLIIVLAGPAMILLAQHIL